MFMKFCRPYVTAVILLSFVSTILNPLQVHLRMLTIGGRVGLGLRWLWTVCLEHTFAISCVQARYVVS